MTQVFVSYSRADAARAQPILDALTRSGFDVSQLRDLAPGVDFAEAITEQIESADCVVIVWSEAAANSEWVQQEIHLAIEAWSAGKLLLVSLDDAPLPVGLRDLETIPYPDGATHTDEIVHRVEQVVHGEQQLRPPVAYSRMPEEPLAEMASLPPSRARARWGVIGGVLAMLLVAGFGAYLFVESGQLGEPVGGAATPGFGGAPSPVSPAPAPPLPPLDEWGLDLPETPASEPGTMPNYEINRDLRGPDPLLVALVTGLAGIAIGAGLAWVLWRWSRRRRAQREAPALPVGVQAAAAALPEGLPVFVSYSRQDLRDVDRLVQQIEQAGYGVWIDRQAHGSQRYAAPIVRAIKSAQLVALMCSQNAFSSDHVIREIYIAGDHKKPFLVFQLDGSEFPDEVLYFVTGFPRLSVTALDPAGLRTELSRLLVN